MANKSNPGVIPKQKWNSLQMANRIPEVEMERKIREINHFHAEIKRERLLEERRLWDEMYNDDKILSKSIARLPRREVVSRMVLVPKEPEDDVQLSFSDYYRQFIIFKAKRMARIFGPSGTRQPRYRDLYRQELAPARNNRRNVQRLFKKYQEEQAAVQKKLDILNEDANQAEPDETSHFPFEANDGTSDFINKRKFSLRTQQAKRQHRRSISERRLAEDYGTTTSDMDDKNKTDVQQTTTDDKQTTLEQISPQDVNTEPAFHLPTISDKFKSSSDRAFKKDLACAEDGHVSPLPEVRKKTPILEIYKRRRRRKSSSQSSSESDEDD